VTSYPTPGAIPLADCPICGGQHQPDAIPVRQRRTLRYIAGSFTCPAFEAAAYQLGDSAFVDLDAIRAEAAETVQHDQAAGRFGRHHRG